MSGTWEMKLRRKHRIEYNIGTTHVSKKIADLTEDFLEDSTQVETVVLFWRSIGKNTNPSPVRYHTTQPLVWSLFSEASYPLRLRTLQ